MPNRKTCREGNGHRRARHTEEMVLRVNVTASRCSGQGGFAATCTAPFGEPPPQPTAKEQCKGGGYEEFGFRNQGQCVAFVQRGPKGGGR